MLVLNAFTKDNDYGALAQKHRKNGDGPLAYPREILFLLVDVAMKERPVEDLQWQRDKLIAWLHAVYNAAPSTTSKAYKKAQKALQKQQDMTFTSTRLPRELRRTSRPRK